MKNDFNDIPKYKKKKDSSVSKSKLKSKHKHNYSKECLLIAKGSKYPHYATYCSICGKINIIRFGETIDDNGVCRMLSASEVYEKYKNLEKIKVENIWQKYIPI